MEANEADVEEKGASPIGSDAVRNTALAGRSPRHDAHRGHCPSTLLQLVLFLELPCCTVPTGTKHSAHASPFRARGLSILATCSGEAWVHCLNCSDAVTASGFRTALPMAAHHDR